MVPLTHCLPPPQQCNGRSWTLSSRRRTPAASTACLKRSCGDASSAGARHAAIRQVKAWQRSDRTAWIEYCK
eukprot:1517137-Prorocentrum_lima.AAC.1